MELLGTLGFIAANLLTLFIVVALILFSLSMRPFSKKFAPFVPVSGAVLDQIVKALHIKPDSVVYDLGSGDGKVLFASFRKEPHARYIGIDKHLFPHFLSRFKSFFVKGENRPHFIHGDFFKSDLGEATHIFTYLYGSVMDSLLPKFQKELKPGTRLVSCDFAFKDRQPDEVILLDRMGTKLCKRLLIYTF